jgi:hypothetical protein
MICMVKLPTLSLLVVGQKIVRKASLNRMKEVSELADED